MMAVPLLRHGELLGILAFISSSPSRTYRAADLPLALALADRAAVAIENARLYHAAVHATQLRDQMLGIVAHDLRNPLNAILMQASAMQRRGAEPERRTPKPRTIIHRAATRMNRLIEDLLDVARMEAGQLRVERARVDANALVVEAADSQRPQAASSALELQLDLAPSLPDVFGDRDRLLQVFENLIGNAMKFTSSGGRVAIGAQSRQDDVLFWVSDTGCGMAAETLPRVFDRFWQATRPGRVGAGLGLSITKGIVDAHAGRIWVESTLGRGTTFFFAIPRAEPATTGASELLH
jgi:signal transduction histidine kinase